MQIHIYFDLYYVELYLNIMFIKLQKMDHQASKFLKETFIKKKKKKKKKKKHLNKPEKKKVF